MAIAKSNLDIINIDEGDGDSARETKINFLGFLDGDNDISDVYSGIGGTTQSTGSGQNDVTFGGTFTGTSATTYYVKIDATGDPDTFSWSKDNFSTTEATAVSFISGSPITLDNGVTVTATSQTGHDLNDVWQMTTVVDISEPHVLAQFVVNHEGTSADDKGELILKTNDGDDGLTPASTVFTAHANGDITFSGTIVETSSRELKTNIEPLNDSLNKIMSLQGVYFNWKHKLEEQREIGMIVEDVFQIAPELVSYANDKPAALKYSKMVSLLIEGMKEQQAQIEDLKAEIKTLKN